MIEMRDLTRRFGDVTAVQGLTLQVGQGEVLGLLGPNGAGKTTTVRMLCCLIAKTSGEATIAGYAVGNGTDSLRIRGLIGLVSDNLGLYDALSAYDNLRFYGRLYGCPEDRIRKNAERLLTMLALWDRRDVAAGSFSKGMKQKLGIARALVHDPQILFLDEPTANLDPESARTVRDSILELKAEKRTIVLNTHNLAEAQRICDRIAILNTRLVVAGTPEELERSAGGRRISIRLENLDQTREKLADTLRNLVPEAEVTAEGDELQVVTPDPERHTPEVVAAVVGAGGRVRFAGVTGASLEDAYLRLVGRER